MGLRGVRAYDENAAGILKLINRVGHSTTAECPCKAGNRRCVAEPGAMVNIISTNRCTNKLLKDVVVLIGALGR